MTPHPDRAGNGLSLAIKSVKTRIVVCPDFTTPPARSQTPSARDFAFRSRPYYLYGAGGERNRGVGSETMTRVSEKEASKRRRFVLASRPLAIRKNRAPTVRYYVSLVVACFPRTAFVKWVMGRDACRWQSN